MYLMSPSLHFLDGTAVTAVIIFCHHEEQLQQIPTKYKGMYELLLRIILFATFDSSFDHISSESISNQFSSIYTLFARSADMLNVQIIMMYLLSSSEKI